MLLLLAAIYITDALGRLTHFTQPGSSLSRRHSPASGCFLALTAGVVGLIAVTTPALSSSSMSSDWSEEPRPKRLRTGSAEFSTIRG
jgi:hypothetical protein